MKLLLSTHKFNQRTLTIEGSISVQLTSCLTGLELTKQVKLLLIQHKQSSWIQTKLMVGQTYSDTSPEVSILWFNLFIVTSCNNIFWR